MTESQLTPIKNLKFKGVSFGYEDSAPVFSQIDFDFPMNRFVWVKGQGGTGKSSLLKILAGLVQPEHGHLIINDCEDVTQFSFSEFIRFRLNMGYSFDFGGLINNRTIYENLMLPITYHNFWHPDEAHRRVVELMKQFGLLEVQNKRPWSVPGGMRKATCVVRALLLKPDLLLLDEPTMGLRNEPRQALMDYLRDNLAPKGHLKHVFVASQDAKFMEQFYDLELVLEKEKFVLQKREVKAS